MNLPAAGGDNRPEISILIGLASREDDPGTLRLLDALHNQQGNCNHEIIVADRRQDHLSRAIALAYPQVKILAATPDTSLPALRTLALAHARADLVAVIADHCLPSPGWLAAFQAAFKQAPQRLVAAGGLVVNSTGTRAAQRAAFTFEYAPFLPPLPAADSDQVPGMNICYRRQALGQASHEQLCEAFWENFLHAELKSHGGIFRTEPDARVTYLKDWTCAAFLRQRFRYSRYYAARRLHGQSLFRRGIMAILSLLLPPLLLVRHARAMAGRDRSQRAGLAAWPFLLLFSLAAAAGECTGAWRGAGKALEELA